MYGVRTLADVPGLSTPSAAAGRSACLNELAYASPLLRAHGTHNRDYERGYSAGHSRGFRVGKQSCDDGPVVRPPDFGDYQRGYRKGEKEGYEAGPSPPPTSFTANLTTSHPCTPKLLQANSPSRRNHRIHHVP